MPFLVLVPPILIGGQGDQLHAADGFLSVPIALLMWALSAVCIALSVRRANRSIDERIVPLMGVMAAFIFAAQMFNFPVAGGTSGHLLGGVLAGLVHAASAEIGGFAHLFFKSAQLKNTAAGKVPLIGASGAVAGVIAAYVLLYPRVRVWVLAFRFIPLNITAALALGVWIVSQFVMLLIPDKGPIAWWAHIGGICAGALLVVVMRRPDVPLWGGPAETKPAPGPGV